MGAVTLTHLRGHVSSPTPRGAGPRAGEGGAMLGDAVRRGLRVWVSLGSRFSGQVAAQERVMDLGALRKSYRRDEEVKWGEASGGGGAGEREGPEVGGAGSWSLASVRGSVTLRGGWTGTSSLVPVPAGFDDAAVTPERARSHGYGVSARWGRPTGSGSCACLLWG